MNYITHLNSFFSKAESQDWLSPHHQSLYLTLFRIWNQTGFKQTFTIYRDQVMEKAKIGSKSTYYRCLRELENAGYFIYHTPKLKYEAAMITMIRFTCTRNGTTHVPDLNPVSPTNDTPHVPQMGHFPKQEDKTLSNYHSNVQPIPTQEEVHQFFKLHNYPYFKAVSFWYHYESRGWAAVKDWQKLAHKWISGKNSTNPQTTKDASHSTGTDESYKEPF